MTDSLAPCPFCGQEAEQDFQQSYRDMQTGRVDHGAAVYCTGCNANMIMCRGDHPGLSDEERMAVVVEGWNRRTPPPSSHLLGLSDAQVEAVLHLVESRLCIIWSKIGAREEFANQLRVLEPAPEDPVGLCEACGEPFEDGDLVYWMADDTGHIHADCCGPERDSYVGPDGAPLKDGDPIPEPFAYRDPRTTTEGKDNG